MAEDRAPELSLQQYADIVAALADPQADRIEVLAAHGLREPQWGVIEAAWQSAVDGTGEDQEPPTAVVQFAEAFSRAQRARVVGVLPFAKYAEATRALRRGTGVAEALERMQVSLPQYLKAHVHWMHVMTDDAALAAHLACALASS